MLHMSSHLLNLLHLHLLCLKWHVCECLLKVNEAVNIWVQWSRKQDFPQIKVWEEGCVCHSLTVSQKWLVPINKHMLVLISWRIRKQLTLTLGAACVHCAVMLSLWKSTAGPWVSEHVKTCGELLAAVADRSTVDTTQSSSRHPLICWVLKPPSSRRSRTARSHKWLVFDKVTSVLEG